ncbi:RNA polymerase sigma factor [Streptomyces clavifer]|uniref:RNA polymerase sigma factor n=1 Tax=Streptomyces clavifer TaxID=68188 RepID=UPI003091EA09|nr:sigma-70 family RNA polymerase sigma factor [Streptomyces clavifer]WRY80067.1 sigma-70 family RNA polymerase sigma factor [Streptomyces clavifer]WRY86252.1 sigma-70 family RNA polymerase sigma factor [Streptomyces clavifer]WRY86261.1 sigma-70 family RNA polymerase sigma factor [Streptomyces clavifer]
MQSLMYEQRFGELYRDHRGAIETYAARRVHPDRVADVVADVFLTAWRRMEDIGDADELPWLYGVARRTLANDRRSQRRQLSLTELLAAQPASFNSSEHADSAVAMADLAKAFSLLKEEDQEILRLAIWENLSTSGQASVLKCSMATARVRLFRARKRLKKILFGFDASYGAGARVKEQSHA